MSTPVAKITATGVSAPSYPEVLAWYQSQYRGIYGADVYLEPDSQDGQWLAIQAQALHDVNQTVVATYNAYSPAGAQGAGLASAVKINGLAKQGATNSTADITIAGEAGTPIRNGIVGDAFSMQWALPGLVTIPSGGSITQTATCTTPGAIAAEAGSITRILTPTRGWQTATNAAAATPGQDVESDAVLRQRQASSTQSPAQTKLEAIVGALANVRGVRAVQPYENDSAATDSNGLPSHSICMVVQGGDATEIAETIALKKSEGTGTFGATSTTVIDKYGVPVLIKFQRPASVRLIATITLQARTGYVSSTGNKMRQAASGYVAALAIGSEVDVSKIEGAANLDNGALSRTFNIQSLTIARFGDALAGSDLVMTFAEEPSLDVADITLTVV